MRKRPHRLLHSLVFSSALVTGCSDSHGTGEDAGAPDDAGPSAPDAPIAPIDASLVDAPETADAFVPSDAFDSVDAPEAHDAWLGDGGDPRSCESGWPTTKGVICEPLAGTDFIECCGSFAEDPDAGPPCCLMPADAGVPIHP